MSNTINQPGQDLPEPVLPGGNGEDAIGRPDGGAGTGHDMPTSPVETNPAGEPDPTQPAPAVPGMPGGA